MRKKAGIACIAAGALLMLAALLLFVYNYREADRAGNASADVLPELQAAIVQAEQAHVDLPSIQESEEQIPTAEIDGNEYIGYLTIPALGLELPVMAELDSARLETAPCRYYGTPNDNLVIAGHNYSRHFGRLHDLRIEDPIMLTDAAGGKHLYRVCEIEILAGTAITQMLDSGYDLTLFTCTYGGRDRIAVRCESLPGE